jgi:hypothetical protein
MIDLALANSVSDNRALGNHLVGPKPSRLQGTIIENSIENSRVESDSASSLLSIASQSRGERRFSLISRRPLGRLKNRLLPKEGPVYDLPASR